MSISADATVAIYAKTEGDIFAVRRFCKNLLNTDSLSQGIYGLSFRRESLETSNRCYGIGIAEFSIDDMNFWFSHYGITMLKHVFLNKYVPSDEQAEEEANGKNQDERLKDFCKATGCMIELEECDFRRRERTVAIADEILLHESDELDENYVWMKEDFGKVPASEFWEKWLMKLALDGETA